MIDILLYILVMVISLIGVALNVFSLPGNWLMFVAALGLSIWHAVWDGWTSPHWAWLILLFIILLMAEVVEFMGGMVGAKKFGASKTASWAAIVGAIIGGLVGVPFAGPMLGLSFLLGAIGGAFLAAWIVEVLKKKPMGQALKAATGAALGRGVGIFAKICGGIVVWIGLALTAFPYHVF